MKTRQVRGLLRALLAPVVLMIGATSVSYAGSVSMTVRPDSSFDFKSVSNIVVLPVTAENVDFGRASEGRLPKIKSLLEGAKIKIRSRMIDDFGKLSQKPQTVLFTASPAQGENRSLLLKINIDKYDHGNQATRLLPFAGKAKVFLKAQLLEPKSKKVLVEFVSQAANKSANTSMIGGTDSEVLLHAADKANWGIFDQLSKLTGFKTAKFANFGEKVVKGTKESITINKAEKQELDRVKKKATY